MELNQQIQQVIKNELGLTIEQIINTDFGLLDNYIEKINHRKLKYPNKVVELDLTRGLFGVPTNKGRER